MGLREKLNQNPAVAVACLIVMVAVAAGVLWLSGSTGATTSIARSMFYSDDDGKTWFADRTDQIYPFDHNGKPACRVYVYQGRGQPFVGYLARYTDSARSGLLSLKSKTDPDSIAKANELKNGIEVKKPGDREWVPASGTKGQSIMMVTSPDGGELRGIVP